MFQKHMFCDNTAIHTYRKGTKFIITRVMFFIAVICASLVFSDGSIVKTTSGPVRGKLNHDHNVEYFSYTSIPYAENPTGTLRFKAPVPKKPWSDVLDATKEGPVCPQPEGQYNKTQMSEDCLVLNVHVPARKSRELLPVMVFVHGGGYKSLSGNADVIYGPQFYLKRDVIFVSMNYRLGALGYFSLENEEAPGNAGLKDVVLALKWIKANVERFGGNKDMITVGGSSSGSSICHYLMLTDKTKGLFNRVLLTSGNAVSFRFIQKKPRTNALALADKLGLATNLSHLTQRLTEIDAFDIVDAQEKIYKDERSEMRPFNAFVPSIEPESPEALITNYPLDIIRAGIPNNVPVLAGINSLEGIYYWATIKKNETLVENLPRLFADCIPPDVDYPQWSENYKQLIDSISNVYFNGADLNNFTLHNFLELLSDTQYTFNTDHWIRVYLENNLSNNDLYYYLFDFEGGLNWAKLNYNVTEVPGMAHSDDLGYQFVTKRTEPLLNDIDSRTRRMVDLLITLFTNFIKYGNPTPNSYEGTKWPLYNKDRKYLILSEQPLVGEYGPDHRRFNFWYNVYREFDNYVQEGGQVADNNYV